MKKHWQENHGEEYAKVRAWLGESSAKIASLSWLAAECRKGPGQKDGIPLVPRNHLGRHPEIPYAEEEE